MLKIGKTSWKKERRRKMKKLKNKLSNRTIKINKKPKNNKKKKRY